MIINKINLTEPFGEIIESSLHLWKSHSWQWDVMPALGSVVSVESDDQKIFGTVVQLATGSLDQNRQPFPYQKTQEELKRDQPQIFTLLQTHVTCITVGYSTNTNPNTLYYQLPDYPPKIHAFVQQAGAQEIKNFFSNTAYLHLLATAATPFLPLEDILLALLKQYIEQCALSESYLDNFIYSYSLLIGNDYRKLKMFLQRLQTLVDHGSLTTQTASLYLQ